MKLQGQWWERLHYVLFLPHGDDPNIPGWMTGWTKCSEDRAREIVDAEEKLHHPYVSIAMFEWLHAKMTARAPTP